MSYLGRSPTGSILTGADIADGSISTAKIADNAIVTGKITDGTIATGDIADSAITSAKTTIGIKVAGQFRFSSDFANSGNGQTEDITANWEENDTNYSRVGSAITQSSGIFTFPSTGIYLVTARVSFNPTSASSGVTLSILGTANNSSFAELAKSTSGASGNARPEVMICNAMFDVTNVSTHKIKFATNGGTYITYLASDTSNHNDFTFIRLGDT